MKKMTMASRSIWTSFMRQDHSAVVLDVRKPEEWGKTFMHHALKVDIDCEEKFVEYLNTLNPENHYYVFSKTGKRGEIACELMEKLGFNETFNLAGGILGHQLF